ncbi:8455_t:CDS:2 [Ambispora gerdemannii]|uniref:8455_t:CDS:1 n=1 Tax=Ambispora gerdemannii TaxID=144530 RepID=A0A9N9GRX5_9GLOM|nr:8455_t:CDS:2 [Ambispora gerdemannii]
MSWSKSQIAGYILATTVAKDFQFQLILVKTIGISEVTNIDENHKEDPSII